MNNIFCTVGKFKTFTKEIDFALATKQNIYNKEINLSSNDYGRCTGAQFKNCILYDIPSVDSLVKCIKNLTVLSIYKCKLSKITSDDLQGYECLRDLYIQNCEIDYLPGDLFRHTPDLEIISFFGNKIKYIDSTILDPLRNLKIFCVLRNVNINDKYDSITHRGNVSLEQLKHLIKKKCFRSSDWCLTDKKMTNEIENLKAENGNLKAQFNSIKRLSDEQAMSINSMKFAMISLKKTCTALEKEKKTIESSAKEKEKLICGIKRANINQQQEIRCLRLKLNSTKAIQTKQNKIFEAKCVEFQKKIELMMSQQLKIMKEMAKDFTVQVGMERFKVNKSSLVAYSKILKKFIDEHPNADSLELDDISVDAFKCILNFIVDDNLPPADTNIIDLLDVCCKLEIEAFIPIVSGLIVEQINPLNALNVLFLCRKFNNNDELKMKAFEEFKKNFPYQEINPELASQPEVLKKVLQTKIDFEELTKNG